MVNWLRENWFRIVMALGLLFFVWAYFNAQFLEAKRWCFVHADNFPVFPAGSSSFEECLKYAAQ